MTYFPPIFRLYPSDTHTILHWKLDENVEPLNSSGTNTTLSLTTGFNDGYVREGRTGLFSKACDFTPPTVLTSSDTSVEPPGNSFTISCWVFCRSFPSPSTFIGKTFHLTGTGWNAPFWSISIEPDASGLFITNYAISGTESTLTGPITDPIPTNQWVFLAITFDGVKIKQYINGNLINQSSDINDTIDWGDGGPWCVGGNNLQQTGGHDGLIDDVRVENAVRSLQYLQAQYKDGIGFYELPSTSNFIPTDVGGLVLWLRSDKGVILDGYSISKVKDQSGFISDGIQSNGAERPVYSKYLGQNNHPFMSFDANQKFLTGTLLTPSAPLSDLTFFLVAKFNSDNDRTTMALTDNSFTVDSGLELSMQTPNKFRIERFASGGNQTTDLPADITSTKIYSGTSDDTALQGYINGTAVGTPAGSTTGLNPIYKYVVGASDNTGTSNMDGYIYDYLLYDRVLDSDERVSIVAYLTKKYTIVSTAPPPFLPTNLTGLQIWSRADFGITQSGSLISAWADQSGNSNDFSQTISDDNKPQTITTGIGGFPDILYSGNQYLYNTTSDLATTALTAFMVMQTSTLATNNQLWGKGYASTEWLFTGQGTKLRFAMSSSNIDSDNNINDGLPHYVIATWDKNDASGLISLYVDGVLQVGSDTIISDISGGDSIGTGAEISGSPSTFFPGYTGHLPEVGLYNRKLNLIELGQLNTYLATRSISTAFSVPIDIPNATTWFRADLGMTLSGSDVSTWADQSMAGIAPTMTPLNASPQYEASGINGLPDLTFDGMTQSLVGTSSILGTTAITLFGIFKTSSTTTQFIWGMQYNDYHYSIFINTDVGHPGQLFFFDGAAHSIISPASVADGLPHVFIATYDSGTGDMNLYIDNGITPVATGTGSGVIGNGVADLNAIGSSTGASANDRIFNGSIAEVGSYSVAIGSSDIIALMNYLKDRAGI